MSRIIPKANGEFKLSKGTVAMITAIVTLVEGLHYGADHLTPTRGERGRAISDVQFSKDNQDIISRLDSREKTEQEWRIEVRRDINDLRIRVDRLYDRRGTQFSTNNALDRAGLDAKLTP
jgi:hypothetical protein